MQLSLPEWIGEHDASTRVEILQGLPKSLPPIETSLNEAQGSGVRRISASDSKTVVFVAPAQEDLMIVLHVDRMARTEEQFRRSTTTLPNNF